MKSKYVLFNGQRLDPKTLFNIGANYIERISLVRIRGKLQTALIRTYGRTKICEKEL